MTLLLKYWKFGAMALLVIACGFCWSQWRGEVARRESIEAAQAVNLAAITNARTDLAQCRRNYAAHKSRDMANAEQWRKYMDLAAAELDTLREAKTQTEERAALLAAELQEAKQNDEALNEWAGTVYPDVPGDQLRDLAARIRNQSDDL